MNDINTLRQPLKLSGGISASRIMPGPMEGIMRPGFCRAFNELGLTNLWITPFLRITTHVPRKVKIHEFVEPYRPDLMPVIFQLMGNDPDKIAASAKRIGEFGVAGINLNFACPSSRVLRKNGGGALLKNIPLMAEIINKVKEACPGLSVSVKLRCGFESPDEMRQVIPAVIKTNVDFIALHFRTVEEMYIKIEDGLERLALGVQLAENVPVIGNGDICSPKDAEQMLRQTGCAGVMIGRGLLKNPWIIRELEGQGESGKITADAKKIRFFAKLLEYASEEPEKYWRRSNFTEYAKLIFDRKDPRFETARSLSDEDFIAGKWLVPNE